MARTSLFCFDLCFFSKADFNEKKKKKRVASVFHEFPFSTDFILLPFPTQTQVASSLAASAGWLGQARRAPFPAGTSGGCSREPGEGPSLLPWADVLSQHQESLVDSLVLSPLLPKSLLLCRML